MSSPSVALSLWILPMRLFCLLGLIRTVLEEVEKAEEKEEEEGEEGQFEEEGEDWRERLRFESERYSA